MKTITNTAPTVNTEVRIAPRIGAEAPQATPARIDRTRELVGEEATFESTAAPSREDDFLQLGSRIIRERVRENVAAPTPSLSDQLIESRREDLEAGLTSFANEETFSRADADGDGFITVTELNAIRANSQEDQATSFFAQIGEHLGDFNTQFSREDVLSALDSLGQGATYEATQAGLIEQILAEDSQPTGAPSSLPGTVSREEFNEAYYLAQNGDVAAAVPGAFATAYDHYLQHGAGEGRLPSDNHQEIVREVRLEDYLESFTASGRPLDTGAVLSAYAERYGLGPDSLLVPGDVLNLEPILGAFAEIGLPGASGP